MKRTPILLSAVLLPAIVTSFAVHERTGGADLQIRTVVGDKLELSHYRLIREDGKPPRLVGKSAGKDWSSDLAGLWKLSFITGVAPGYERAKAKAFFQLRGCSSLEGELVGGDPADPNWFRFRMRGGKEGMVLRQHLLALRLQPVRKPKPDPVAITKPKTPAAAKEAAAKEAIVAKKDLDGGFGKALASPPGNRDLIFVEDKKKRVRSFACDVRGVDEKGVAIDFRGEVRSLPLSRVYGIVFGTLSGVEPVFRKPGEVAVELTLRDKRRLRGKVLELDKTHWTLSLAEKLSVRLPTLWIQDATIYSDRQVYVSDLEIKDKIQKPMLGRTWPILRNQAGGGQPLKVGERTWRKGFVLVPDVSFRVDFPRPYARLAGQIGMPRAMVGSATLRFLVDGEQVGEDFKLQADGKVQDIDIDLKGARELSIELEHSADLDAGARVFLGDLRAINTQP